MLAVTRADIPATSNIIKIFRYALCIFYDVLILLIYRDLKKKGTKNLIQLEQYTNLAVKAGDPLIFLMHKGLASELLRNQISI